MEKRLTRPKEGRVFLGVCVGIANYFNIDPIIVRLVFVVLTLWGGSGVLIYIICIFLMPEDKSDKKTSAKTKEDIKERVEAVASEVKTAVKKDNFKMRGEQIFGLIVLLLGVAFLSQKFFSWLNFWRFWPLLLIALGLIIFVGGTRKGDK